MKLHFEPNLDYQHTAIESVCDLFRGQETCRTEFTVTRDALAAQQALAFAQSDLGIGNRLQLLDDELLANLGDIQIRIGRRVLFVRDSLQDRRTKLGRVEPAATERGISSM